MTIPPIQINSSALSDRTERRFSLGQTVAQAAKPAPSAKADPLAAVSAPDLDGNGRYDPGEVKAWHTHAEIAGAVASKVNGDPRIQIVAVGEGHSAQATLLFQTVVETANKAGRKPVALVETPTTPVLDALLDRLNAGTISHEEFLNLGSKEMLRSYDEAVERNRKAGNVIGGERKNLDYFRTRLEVDAISYRDMKPPVPVAFNDPGRFTPGANRDAEMAKVSLAVREKYPDRVQFLQVGAVHAQERPGVKLIPEVLAGNYDWNGAQQSPVDAVNTAASRLSDALGDEAVLSINVDYLETEGVPHTTSDLSGLSPEMEETPGDISAWERKFFDYYIPSRTDDQPRSPKVR